MSDASSIVLATSIPPNIVRYDGAEEIGVAYQQRCIDSWIAAGFHVISINRPQEIERLTKFFPCIEIVSVERDASRACGRKTPFIVDILDVLTRRPENTVGIINADILLAPGGWQKAVASNVQHALVVCQRTEISSLTNFATVPQTSEPYRHGFDVFFFENGHRLDETHRPFAMGIPWWDLWFPIASRLKGLEIKVLREPKAFHLSHPAGFDSRLWSFMTREFAESISATADSNPAAIVPDIASIVESCQRFVSAPRGVLSPLDSVANYVATNCRGLPLLWRAESLYRSPEMKLARLAAVTIARNTATSRMLDRSNGRPHASK